MADVEFIKHEKFDAEQMSRVPDTLEFPNAEKSNLGDFAEIRSALILSKKTADVLERLEPGRHQIFPLKIEASKRYRHLLEAKGYVLVNVCQKIQAVEIEKSKLKQHVLEPPPIPESYFLSSRSRNAGSIAPCRGRSDESERRAPLGWGRRRGGGGP